jgi:hypothetical protein
MHTLATPHVSYAVPHVLVPLTLSCYAGVCVCVCGGDAEEARPLRRILTQRSTLARAAAGRWTPS